MVFLLGMVAGGVIILTLVYGIWVAPYASGGLFSFFLSLVCGAVVALVALFVFLLIPLAESFKPPRV